MPELTSDRDAFVAIMEQSLQMPESEIPSDVDGGFDRAIRQACSFHAKAKPAERSEDFAGDGATTAWDLPEGYVSSFSTPSEAEYPADQNPPRTVRTGPYGLQGVVVAVDVRRRKVRACGIVPSVGEVVRLYYTGAHTVEGVDGADETTLDDVDVEAVAKLAASFLARTMAAWFEQKERSGIDAADLVDHPSLGNGWRTQARDLRKEYDDHMKGPPDTTDAGTPPATAIVNMDPAVSPYRRGFRFWQTVPPVGRGRY